MTVSERIEKLRSLMSEHNMDAYIVPSADNHQSEYVGEHFKARKFITGFTGSAGTAVFTKEDAGLWTDGRYWLQAKRQLQGSGIRLFKIGEPDVPTISEFLADTLSSGAVLGFDGRVVSMGEGQAYEKALEEKQIQFQVGQDLIDQIWEDRPAMAEEPVFVLEEKHTGESTSSKLTRIREVMKEHGATAHIITSLDDIAWLINMRGNDVAYSPLILSYAIVRMDSMDLFISEAKLNEQARLELSKCNVTLHPYHEVYQVVSSLASTETVMIDPAKVNYAIYTNIPSNVQKVEAQNPCILFKAMKNPVELKNIKEAHIKDGIAVTKFMHWIKTTVGKEEITEISAAQKLNTFRSEQEGYLGQSFEPICAYKEHAAMMHYAATEESNAILKPEHFFLNDTGGNYYEGTSDITRTFVLGPVSDELKTHFTAVVRAMVGLAKAKFLYGCKGFTLDVLARGPIWDLGIDYKCGTGHGVGYLLNIHEGPAGFHWSVGPGKVNLQNLEEGMVLTDEPGIYIDGSHGIRIENELVVNKEECTDFGQFMNFEVITFAPIDLDGINPEEMTQAERAYLNHYHAQVFEKVSPHLNPEQTAWLKEYTRAI